MIASGPGILLWFRFGWDVHEEDHVVSHTGPGRKSGPGRAAQDPFSPSPKIGIMYGRRIDESSPFAHTLVELS